MTGKKVFANLIMVFLYSTYMKPLDFLFLDKYVDFISDKAGDTLIWSCHVQCFEYKMILEFGFCSMTIYSSHTHLIFLIKHTVIESDC